MAAGTSPGITVLTNGDFAAAHQASNEDLGVAIGSGTTPSGYGLVR